MTKGTEQRPSELCRWIALQILHTSVVLASGGVQQNTTTTSEKFTTTEPEGWKIRGGSGEPRICRSPGKTREFHDGAGLALRGVGTWNAGHGTQMVFGRNLGKDPCVWFWKAAVLGKSLTWSVFKWRPRVNRAATWFEIRSYSQNWWIFGHTFERRGI